MTAQHWIVGIVVAWAVAYSGWALLPAGLRRRAASRLSGRIARWGVSAARAQRVERALSSSGGCSTCADCAGCAPKGGAQPQVVALPVSRRGARD